MGGAADEAGGLYRRSVAMLFTAYGLNGRWCAVARRQASLTEASIALTVTSAIVTSGLGQELPEPAVRSA